jgi:hypothetical protein
MDKVIVFVPRHDQCDEWIKVACEFDNALSMLIANLVEAPRNARRVLTRADNKLMDLLEDTEQVHLTLRPRSDDPRPQDLTEVMRKLGDELNEIAPDVVGKTIRPVMKLLPLAQFGYVS